MKFSSRFTHFNKQNASFSTDLKIVSQRKLRKDELISQKIIEIFHKNFNFIYANRKLCLRNEEE